MTRKIIQTKLNIPRLQSNHFSRDKLLAKIDRSNQGNLVLVSAPAGYGKTTLVSEWTKEHQDSCAWYSLNTEDNNVITFVYYLVQALKNVNPKFGETVIDEIDMMNQFGIETLFISLINDFIEYNKDVTLVLDDYHLINNKEIQKGVNFILEHLPDNTRVIVITRNHECLPITKLRAKNRLLEITVDDLIFDFDEISIFLNEYLHQKLSSEDIMFIQEKTEGWVTSLHLFAMSLLRQEDPKEFIESFSGNHEYVFDYLLEEVYNQQPRLIQKFLMTTALFNRFNSSLASYMLETTEEDASERLKEVIKSNLFIVSLDNEKVWYRYHHLFQDFLKKKFFEIPLKEELVLDIFDYASVWFKEQGFINEAVNNALIARKYEFAANIIEIKWATMRSKLECQQWHEWMQQLPPSSIENRPISNIGYAWSLLDSGNADESFYYIETAEKLYNEYLKGNETVVIDDKDSLKRMETIIHVVKAYYYIVKNDVNTAFKHAEASKDNLVYTYEKQLISQILAVAYWCMGRLDDALKSLNTKNTNVRMKIALSIAHGKITMNQGKLQQSIEYYKGVLELIDKNKNININVEPNIYNELAQIYLYQGDYEETSKCLEKSSNLGSDDSEKTWRYYYYKVRSLLLKEKFQYDQALIDLNKAEEAFFEKALRDTETIDALRTNIYIEQMKTSLVLEYIDKFKEIPDKIPFIEEGNYITLIKALIYKYKHMKTEESLHQAENILQVLQRQFKEDVRLTKMVDGMIMQTEIHLMNNRRRSASESLQDAIRLASIENYIYPFIEAGSFLKTLLTDATLGWVHKDFVVEVIKHISQSLKLKDKVLHPDKMDQLITPLSKRETEVLKLIAQGLTNDEISKTLFLALSTIKNYNQSLFGKLQVKNRTEAIKKAHDLDII